MKLQIERQTLRWRVDEAELTQLLTDGTLHGVTRLGAAQSFSLGLRCIEGADALMHATGDSWTLELPRAALQDYVASLPSRDALCISIADRPDLDIRFEVDVRDSIRLRGTPRRVR